MKHALDSKTKIPIISWADEIDEKSLAQAKDLTELPFAHHHIALMPDVHAGYGMPIGGVLTALDAIIPYAVGVDIGCGVKVIKTNLSVDDLSKERLRMVLNQIQRNVPTGFEHHKTPQESKIFKKVPEVEIIQKEFKSAQRQMGTLGGGNHFIEIQKGQDGGIWAMVHCGSRNLGKKVADFYHKKALEYDQKNNLEYVNSELAWLPLDSSFVDLTQLPHLGDENFYHPRGERSPQLRKQSSRQTLDTALGRGYFEAMNFCLDFAHENREKVMDVVKNALGNKTEFEDNIHHNYASVETHFGKEAIIHRKGAIQAKKGQKVIVPGSMGTKSYVGKGLGEPDSFESCAHGAGRAMGRGEAKRKITAEQVIEEMQVKNIELFKVKKHDVAEEASAAYKNIDEVMEAQKDLVEITDILEPLGVVKG